MQKKSGLVATCNCVPDPGQPRKLFDEQQLNALCESMKAVGQQVPVIGYSHEGKFVLLDGERRWRAANRAGMPELSAVMLTERPSLADLRLLQATIDVHRASLTPMERSNLLAELQHETGWAQAELGEHVSLPQGTVSKLLALQKLTPAVKAMVHAGGLGMERAYLISQVEGHEAQTRMASECSNMPSEKVKGRMRRQGRPEEVKTKRAVFELPGGYRITLAGTEITIEAAIDRLGEAIKEMKRGLSQGFNISTFQRVLRDKARQSC